MLRVRKTGTAVSFLGLGNGSHPKFNKILNAERYSMKPKRSCTVLLFACALWVSFAPVALAQKAGFQKVATIQIPGNPLTAFDIGWVDAVNHKYYLTDRNNRSIDVVDTTTNKVVRQIGGFVGISPKG